MTAKSIRPRFLLRTTNLVALGPGIVRSPTPPNQLVTSVEHVDQVQNVQQTEPAADDDGDDESEDADDGS